MPGARASRVTDSEGSRRQSWRKVTLERKGKSAVAQMLRDREMPVPEKASKRELIDILLPQLKREECTPSHSESSNSTPLRQSSYQSSQSRQSHQSHTPPGERSKHPHKRHRELSGMDVTFFGVSAGSPTADRNPSSLAIRLASEMLLVDAGDGTLRQIMCSEVSYAKVTRVLVTHSHGDHTWGLPCTLTAILHARHGSLHVYGPEGLYDFLAATFAYSYTCLPSRVVVHELRGTELPPRQSRRSGAKLSRIGHRLKVKGKLELDSIYPDEGTGTACPGEPMPAFNDLDGWSDSQNLPVWSLFRTEGDNILVRAGPLRHTVPCYFFTVQEPMRGGHLIPEKCTELGLPPGPVYKDLKAGKAVTTNDGRVIQPEEVTTESLAGRKLCVCGDTTHSRGADSLARNADMLVHEATFRRGMENKAVRVGHSTAGMAGAFARKANAGKLVLNHFGGRFAPVFSEAEGFFETTDDESMSDATGSVGQDEFSSDENDPDKDNNTLESLQEEAEKEFETGSVALAQEFSTFSVPLIHTDKGDEASGSVLTSGGEEQKQGEEANAVPSSDTMRDKKREELQKSSAGAERPQKHEQDSQDNAVALKRGSRRGISSSRKKRRPPHTDQPHSADDGRAAAAPRKRDRQREEQAAQN